jgi:hypothetical protein
LRRRKGRRGRERPKESPFPETGDHVILWSDAVGMRMKMEGARAVGTRAILDFAALKTKQRGLRDGFPPQLGLRVHRAISWLGRAEAEIDDPDVRFVLLWIGFNAAYAADIPRDPSPSARGEFRSFFDAMIALDHDHRIYKAVWERFPHEIRVLLDNKYVYAPFWHHANGLPGYENWEAMLAESRQGVAQALARKDTARILSGLFDRLYVLRNQLVHGGATWNGGVNRGQVRDGAALLGWLLPVFIDLMMSDPGRNWGRPFYPVID